MTQNCEAIERNQDATKEEKKEQQDKPENKQKISKTKNEKVASNKFYCSHHKKYSVHNTADCYTLKNQQSAGNSKVGTKTFSSNGLCKENYLLSKDSSKKKVPDMYMSVVNREKNKSTKKAQKLK